MSKHYTLLVNSRELFDDPECAIGDVLANIELIVVHYHPLVVVTIETINTKML